MAASILVLSSQPVATPSADARACTRTAISAAVQELSPDQARAVEVGAWNWALAQAEIRGNTKIFDGTLRDDYCRRAAHCAANLSTGPLGNGNTWLLPLVLAGAIEPYQVAFLDARALNAHVARDHADTKDRRNLHDRDAYLAVSTLFTCPKCTAQRSTYRQLQTRSGDEGSTLFVHCLDCGHDWKDGD